MAKFIAISAALLTILAGCSDPQTSQTAPVADSQQVIAEEPVAEQASDQQLSDSLLPPGVTLDGSVEQRSMHGYTTKAGQERRVVIYEFSERDVPTMAESLNAAMASAGFRARPEKDGDDGKTRITFTKSGYGRVNAALTEDLGNKPNDPEAAGTFSLDIPVGDLVSAEVEKR